MINENLSAPQIANFFLEKGKEEARPISMLKLIKLCYIAHGWNLGLTGEPLFKESVEAWQYGPVVPSLYHEFKHFGRKPIDRFAQELDLKDFAMTTAEPPKDTQTRAIMEKVWDVYKTSSGNSLINRTHAQGTPWKNNYRLGEKGITIPNQEIQEYYAEMLAKLVN